MMPWIAVSVTGKRGREPKDVAEVSNGPPRTQDKRRSVEARRLASVAEKEAVKQRAQWRNPELKPRADATRSSVAAEVDAAISACAADGRKTRLGSRIVGGREGIRMLSWRGTPKARNSRRGKF